MCPSNRARLIRFQGGLCEELAPSPQNLAFSSIGRLACELHGCCKNLGCDEDEQQIDVDKTSPRPSSAPTHHEVADDYSQDDKKGDDEDPLLVSVPRFRGEAPHDATRLHDVLKSIREDFARCMIKPEPTSDIG